jgi:hypothetical protein
MNDTKCCKCKLKSIFRQGGRGWCSSVTFMGMYNQFGRCSVKKIDSPELKKYELNFKGEK